MGVEAQSAGSKKLVFQKKKNYSRSECQTEDCKYTGLASFMHGAGSM